MGQINVRDAHRFGFGQNGAHKLASYIAKNCSKEMYARTLDQKRYFRSKGNVLLKVDTVRLLPKTMLGAVEAAHSIIALHEYDSLGPATWHACRPSISTSLAAW